MDWTSLVPLALKLLGWVLERSTLSAQAKARFIALVEQAAHEGAIPANLRDRFKDQMKELESGG